jgi:hypothetical protein
VNEKKKKKGKKNGRCAMIVREVAYSVLGCFWLRPADGAEKKTENFGLHAGKIVPYQPRFTN